MSVVACLDLGQVDVIQWVINASVVDGSVVDAWCTSNRWVLERHVSDDNGIASHHCLSSCLKLQLNLLSIAADQLLGNDLGLFLLHLYALRNISPFCLVLRRGSVLQLSFVYFNLAEWHWRHS